MAAKVFISYRRDDSAGYAGRVRDRLERELGRNLLFMDVDGIPLGTNFSKVLHEEVAKCGVLLAMIGPNWPDARDEHGNRRLDDPNDFVRIEIAAALQRNIPVIPILLEGARIPKATQLPEDLKELALRNGMEIRHASFQDDMNRLVRGLKGQSDQAGAGEGHLAGGNASDFPTKTDVARSQLKGPGGPWGFLRDKRNQQVLGWLGGGLVVVATGLWAAFVYFFPPGKSLEAKSPEPTPPSVQANCGGIAIGRDVTGSTITAGTTSNSDCAPKPK
jgi:TIR domain-containing protein